MKMPKLGKIKTYEELIKISKIHTVPVALVPFFGEIVEVEEYEERSSATYITTSTGKQIWTMLTDFEILPYKVLDTVIYTPDENSNIVENAIVVGFSEDKIKIARYVLDKHFPNIIEVPYNSLKKEEE